MNRSGLLALISLLVTPPALHAADAGADRCQLYAQRAVEQYQLLQSHPQCLTNLNPLEWRADPQYHLNGCKLFPAAMSQRAEQDRDDHLRACGALSTAAPAPAPTPAPTPTPTPASAPPASAANAPAASAPSPTATPAPASTPASPIIPAAAKNGSAASAMTTGAKVPTSYTVTNLASAAGIKFEPYAINSHGAISGAASYRDGPGYNRHALIFDGTVHDISGDAAVKAQLGEAINDSGWVTGRAYPGNAPYWYDGSVHVISTPHAHEVGEGLAINASGSVVGDYYVSLSYNLTGSAEPVSAARAFLYDGKFHDLGAPPTSQSFATSINAAGQIAGYATLTSNQFHAFIYDGKFHDLGTLVPGGASRAAAIDDSGRVVGTATDADGHDRAFVYDGSLHNLGTFGGLDSRARAINAAGLMVGTADDASDSYARAFVSNGSALVDLNKRLSGPHEEMVLGDALAINASGSILAKSLKGDFYLLTPSTNEVTGPPPCKLPPGPPQGSGGRITRSGATITLSFKDGCGGEHRYLVARPGFFPPGMAANSDSGGWIYAAPDKQSGINFNLAPSGDVSATTLSGASLQRGL